MGGCDLSEPSALALALDFVGLLSRLCSNLRENLTPTAFCLIARGCSATLGKETPDPFYTEGVAPIVVGEDKRLQNYVG
jgi:hypothetical protein